MSKAIHVKLSIISYHTLPYHSKHVVVLIGQYEVHTGFFSDTNIHALLYDTGQTMDVEDEP